MTIEERVGCIVEEKLAPIRRALKFLAADVDRLVKAERMHAARSARAAEKAARDLGVR